MLETKALISPNKLPQLSGPSISSLQSVKLPKLELKDSNKLMCREPPHRSSEHSTSSQKTAYSQPDHQKIPGQSDASDLSVKSDEVSGAGGEEGASCSELTYGAGAPPPLTLQKIQPVVTLTRLPSV